MSKNESVGSLTNEESAEVATLSQAKPGAIVQPIALAFEELKLKVEAILFASDRALEIAEIRELVGNVSLTDVRLAIKDLGHDFEGRSVEIVEVGRRFQLRTRTAYQETVSRLFSGKARSLSKAALETLAIVAYRQPVTRAEVAALRQVDSSHLISALKDKELIFASGTRKELGNPVEYRTAPKFLEVFGLASLDDLPRLRSLQMNPDDAAEVRKALEHFDAPEPSQQAEDVPQASDLNFIEEAEPPLAPNVPLESELKEPETAASKQEQRLGAVSAPMVLFAADEESLSQESDADEDQAAQSGRLQSVEALLRPVSTNRGQAKPRQPQAEGDAGPDTPATST